MLLAELLQISEARKSELEYTEKKVKGQIDRVIATLEGNQSGKFTKLISRYKKLQKGVQALAQQQELLNTRLKEEVEDYFDAEDEVFTRVIETISATMTIAKKTTSVSTKVDYPAILEDLVSQLTELVPDLTEKVQELTEKHTTITKTEKSPALRTTIKDTLKEGTFTDAINELKRTLKSFLSSIKKWGTGFDKRLKKVTDQML